MSLVYRNIIENWPPIGWFNSLAGIVKRRFASYVKSHLATSSGDSSKKDRDHYGHPLQPTSPYHFDKLRQGAPTSSSTPSSPHFGNRSQFDHYEKERMAAHSPRVLNNVDRRHRSPDPPPRLVSFFLFTWNGRSFYVDFEIREFRSFWFCFGWSRESFKIFQNFVRKVHRENTLKIHVFWMIILNFRSLQIQQRSITSIAASQLAWVWKSSGSPVTFTSTEVRFK